MANPEDTSTPQPDLASEFRVESPSSATPADLYDPSLFRVDPAGVNHTTASKVLTAIPVKKPSKEVFFRAHPSLKLTAAVLELKDARETYLVLPQVVPAISSNVTPRVLTLCVTRAGDPFLWPVPVPGGSKSAWTDTAVTTADLAERKWVRMAANMGAGYYDVWEAPALDHVPVWPDLDMGGVLKLAFGQNIIRDITHPVVRGLMGEV